MDNNNVAMQKEVKTLDNLVLLDSYKVSINEKGDAIIYGKNGIETFYIGIVPNAFNLTATEVNERVKIVLDNEGYALKPKEEPTPRVKRKYTKHVHLGLASEYGKVTLKLAEGSMPEHKVYALYLKGTDRFVTRMDEKGIYVSKSKDVKTKPLYFTEADVKCIKNTDDFDFVKMTVKAKWIKNKIAPTD